ncbi:MAG: TIGR00725 family protein [Beijerinckiaceae bacterium]|jgi:hypothetical protein|nr:TIGR00725 family protein [Beijerinckiaceae bacterium]
MPLTLTLPDILRDDAGRRFDTASHRWLPAESGWAAGVQIPAQDALRVALRVGARRLPVGVIGPNDASASELAMAEAAGRGIAQLGLPLICGGRGGCMQAASRGAAEAGGLVIGVLPSTDPLSANPFVSVPVASGIGEARNAIIASACFALVAVGGGHGTLSEIALGLKMERLVITMPDANRVDGALECSVIDTAMDAIAERYFRVAP